VIGNWNISFFSCPVMGISCICLRSSLDIIQVSEQDLEALYVEANTFSLASHIFWALWGLIQVLYFLFYSLNAFIVEWSFSVTLLLMINRQRCPQLNLIIFVTFSFDTMSTKDRKRSVSCLHGPIFQEAIMSR